MAAASPAAPAGAPCTFCGTPGATMKCARCGTAYHSVACQKEDWPTHKAVCKAKPVEAVKYTIPPDAERCSGCRGWGLGLVGADGKCAHCRGSA
jgi:hypothetical protein